MEYHVRREYTVCRIPTATVNKVKIYSPIRTTFDVQTIFLYADNFCTLNVVFPGQNVYCLCNLARCFGNEWKKCEPKTDSESLIVELKITNHREYDLHKGESIIEDGRTTLVLYVFPKFRTLTLQAQCLPRIPSRHFHFERNTESPFAFGFIATKRYMYAKIPLGLLPFCVCQNMIW